jgi:hypothetical protein
MKPLGWKNKFAATSDESKLWALGQKKSLHHYVGWESEMFRTAGELFFLDFSFYRTSQDLGITGN